MSDLSTEAVLLTGGASTRLGQDKASLRFGGATMGEAMVAALNIWCGKVTVLGRKPIAGAEFLPDENEFCGPLSALARFVPGADLVFVASCDMPRFHPLIIESLRSAMTASTDASVPVLRGVRQPLCALYRRRAFESIPKTLATGKKSLMAWIDRLTVAELNEEALRADGVDPEEFESFNTPEELEEIGRKLVSAAQVPPPELGE